MTHKLKGSYVYLAGPIEQASDHGQEWRNEFIRKCRLNNIDINVLNPCNKPDNCTQEISVNSDKRKVDEFREHNQWEIMQDFVKQFRREDLRFVDISDFLVIYIDPDIHMCGSYDELITAERQCKPLFAIVKGGIKRLPTWLFGVFPLDHVFSSVDECVNYLKDLDQGTKSLDNKWVLVRHYFN